MAHSSLTISGVRVGKAGRSMRHHSAVDAPVESMMDGQLPSLHADDGAVATAEREELPGGGQPVGGTRRQIPPKLYRIGEVVEYSGMSRQTIHNYTTMGLLHESRWTQGGHRLYDESVFGRLDRIAELKAAHKSIDDIREHFRQADSR